MMLHYCRLNFTDPANGLDPDLTALIEAISPLLTSLNSSVVCSAVLLLHYNGGPKMSFKRPAQALVRLLSYSQEEVVHVLRTILRLIKQGRTEFQGLFTNFNIFYDELHEIQGLKLRILESICTLANVNWILRELKAYLTSADLKLAMKAVHILGKIAVRLPSVASSSLRNLMSIVNSSEGLWY